jgi:hypothetical protein
MALRDVVYAPKVEQEQPRARSRKAKLLKEAKRIDRERERNVERYSLLSWRVGGVTTRVPKEIGGAGNREPMLIFWAGEDDMDVVGLDLGRVGYAEQRYTEGMFRWGKKLLAPEGDRDENVNTILELKSVNLH